MKPDQTYGRLLVGERIQRYRTLSGLSRRDVANRLGQNGEVQVRRWESGDVFPRLWQIGRLAVLFGVEPGVLLGSREEWERLVLGENGR